MATTYANRSVTVNSVANTWVQLLPANANRISLIISCGVSDATNNAIGISGNNNLSGQFLQTAKPFQLILPFRDWGPVIQQDIWFNFIQGGEPCTATEVWKVGTVK